MPQLLGSALSLPVVSLLVAVSLAGSLRSQTQAICNFTYFDPPANFIYGFYPNGINHYNTVVGGVFGQTQNAEKAFIRYSGGGMNLLSVPNATWTELNRRNIHGTSVGAYGSGTSSLPPGSGSNGVILNAGSFATLNFPGSPSTALYGINKYSTIVGTGLDPKTKGAFGFKYANGTFTKIKYPGAVQTIVTAINDNGVIVGGYEKGSFQNPWFGFIRQKDGTFKSLSYIPGDISDSGVIVADNSIHYPNGTVKVVYVPDRQTPGPPASTISVTSPEAQALALFASRATSQSATRSARAHLRISFRASARAIVMG
jgi:uncharacterized membrane protein